MSRSADDLFERLAEIESLIPDGGLILTRDEKDRLIEAVGGVVRFADILYGERRE